MKLECAIGRIQEDLSRQDIRDAASRLAEYIYAHKEKSLHLTYSSLAEIAETRSTEVILLVAQYCTGARIELLEQKFELIIKNEAIQLEDEYVYEAIKGGVLINPETGQPVPNHKEHIFPYFTPGKGVE